VYVIGRRIHNTKNKNKVPQKYYPATGRKNYRGVALVAELEARAENAAAQAQLEREHEAKLASGSV